MSTEKTVDELRKEAFASAKEIVKTDAMEAFQLIRQYLSFPNRVPPEEWTNTWDLFSIIAGEIVGPEFSERAQGVAFGYNDVQSLYDFGYDLIDVGLPKISASIFKRTDELEPGNPAVISEYVAALDRSGLSAEIVNVFDTYEHLLGETFIFRYLNAFAGIMTQDIAKTKACLEKYPLEPSGEEEEFMAARIETFLHRISTFETKKGSAIGEHDLRAWQFVTTGSVLLHVSPYGFEEGMHGRYAYVQDSEALCLEGLRKLKAIFAATSFDVPKVMAPKDRASEILGRAAAEYFGCPFSFFEDNPTEPGLVVTYDLTELSTETLELLFHKQADQVLFTHSVNWVNPPFFSPDFHTFQCQVNISPWAEKQTWDKDGEPNVVPADEAPATEIATRILSQSKSEHEGEEAENIVVEFTMSALDLGLKPTAFLGAIERPQFWESSPVNSNKFD